MSTTTTPGTSRTGPLSGDRTTVTLRVNGVEHALQIDPRATLLDALREGLGDQLHPVQVAFVEQDAFQCGYCTPGQIISAVALLQEGHIGSEGEIREWMSGNICRRGAYPNIVAAIQQVAVQQVPEGRRS